MRIEIGRSGFSFEGNPDEIPFLDSAAFFKYVLKAYTVSSAAEMVTLNAQLEKHLPPAVDATKKASETHPSFTDPSLYLPSTSIQPEDFPRPVPAPPFLEPTVIQKKITIDNTDIPPKWDMKKVGEYVLVLVLIALTGFLGVGTFTKHLNHFTTATPKAPKPTPSTTPLPTPNMVPSPTPLPVPIPPPPPTTADL